MRSTPTPELTRFAEDVRKGLSSDPKYLSSQYFYDDEGSRLFQEIMKLPEYYLTRCEREIFETRAAEIGLAFADESGGFDLIELGAGDGSKTAILIGEMLRSGLDVEYSPIDISNEALDALTAKFSKDLPHLKMSPRNGDYFEILGSLKSSGGRRKVLLFLGSNIGNFAMDKAVDFFRSLRGVMNGHDRLFVGFDLQKDPHTIAAAYDDAAGVTARFNLNLLTRINRELGGNFDITKFAHHANYRPIEGSARSFLISREEQTVRIEALAAEFQFGQWEAIFMEISQKYSLKMIADLAEASGFQVSQNFFDGRHYFCDSLWKPV